MPIHRRRRFFALGEDQRQIPGSTDSQEAADPSLPPVGDEPTDTFTDPDSPEPPNEEAEFSDGTPFAVKALTERRLKPWRRVSIPAALGLALLSAALGGLMVRFLSTNTNHSGDHRERKDAVLLTPGDQQELDAAYAARDARHFDEAEQQFIALARKHPDWTAMPLEVGRTLLHRQKYLGARAALNGVAAQGEEGAVATLLIGVAYDAEKSYPEAEGSFAKAVALDPTQADAYFLWGECLRGQGKLAEAITEYRSALLRNEDETGAGLYRLKLWLCKIEAGQVEADTNAEIDAALARPYPPMEALFAAAARELKAGDLRLAAAHLVRARERADPTIFLAVLNDPLFVEARSTPELSAMIRSVSPAASGQPAGASVGNAPGAPVPLPPAASPTKRD